MTTILFKTCAWCGIETDNMPLCELHAAQAEAEQLFQDWKSAEERVTDLKRALDARHLIWTQDQRTIDDLRAQLAACHEAIGAALALLRQEQVSAAMLVLDDALKGRTR